MKKISTISVVLAVAIFLSVLFVLPSTAYADGSKIAFTSYRDGNHEIYIMNSDGTGQTRLTDNSVNDSYPSFSHNGTVAAAAAAAPYVEPIWIRPGPMVCRNVWVNENGNFQFIFWYPYRDNNWVRIYEMSGKMVYEVDMPYDNPNLIVDLPNGMYTVKTFTVGSTEPIQTFIIGK